LLPDNQFKPAPLARNYKVADEKFTKEAAQKYLEKIIN
jgi:hypothetical protein